MKPEIKIEDSDKVKDEDEFRSIMEEDLYVRTSGDSFFLGLQILSKYIDPMEHRIIGGADHDIVFGPDLCELIEEGITVKDAKKLCELNWMVKGECIAKFV